MIGPFAEVHRPMAVETQGGPGDADLLARSRRGDQEAHAALFDQHLRALSDRVRRVLPRRVLGRISVADVVQETRILAFREIDTFASDRVGAYRAWLLRIGLNKAREARRAHAGAARRAVGRERGRVAGTAACTLPGQGPSPSQAAMAEELRGQVRAALDALGPADAEVLRLAGLQGLALREVALRMARSEAAIKKLYGRALVRLGKVLPTHRDRS